jgi:hypothetical protein
MPSSWQSYGSTDAYREPTATNRARSHVDSIHFQSSRKGAPEPSEETADKGAARQKTSRAGTAIPKAQDQGIKFQDDSELEQLSRVWSQYRYDRLDSRRVFSGMRIAPH